MAGHRRNGCKLPEDLPISQGYGSYKARWTKINFYTGAAEGKEKWGSNTHPWRAREHELIMVVWGGSPSGGPGAEPPVWVRGEAPLQPTTFFCVKNSNFQYICYSFARNDVLFELLLL